MGDTLSKMGEKLRLQSCRADVRVKRREGREIEIKVKKYNSLVDCLSVDEGGNGSESKSKEFKMLNWEGYVQRFLSITTSDDKKHRFKLKQVPVAVAADNNIFWVYSLNESRDLFAGVGGVGVLKNVNIELIETLAEAPPVKKVPVATYNSGKKTLTYSKYEIGSRGINYLADMVGQIIRLSFNKTPIDGHFLGGVGDIPLSWDFHDRWIYAKVAGFSVEGDDVMVRLRTDDIKTKGKYANEKVPQALNNVNSGEYYVGIMEASSVAGIDVLLVDDFIIGLANGKTRLRFKARETRRLSFDAATETIGSVVSNKYIEGMIKTRENNPQLGIKLRVKTKSGANYFVFAMDNLERDGLVWRGEAWVPDIFSSDDIVNVWLSSGSGKPLLNFPSWF